MLIIQLLKETNTRCVKAKQSYQPAFLHKRKCVSSFHAVKWFGTTYRPDDCVVEMMTIAWRQHERIHHILERHSQKFPHPFLWLWCSLQYSTDINTTPHERQIMNAYCYSCLSSAFTFSPFMDITIHISLYQPAMMFLVNTEKWRFGLGFVLLGCSRTRTVQLLPHKHTILLPVNVLAFLCQRILQLMS